MADPAEERKDTDTDLTGHRPASLDTRTRRPVLARAAVAAGTLLLVAGCAGADAPPVEVVSITSEGFSPASITVPVGTEVRFVNQVAGRASVTSLEGTRQAGTGPAGIDPADADSATATDTAVDTTTARTSAGTPSFDSGPLGQGEAFALLLDEPGEHIYHSTFHADLHWVGTISVEGR